jgi:hypothetical protein
MVKHLGRILEQVGLESVSALQECLKSGAEKKPLFSKAQETSKRVKRRLSMRE